MLLDVTRRDDLSSRAITLLRKYRATEDPQVRTSLLKQVAPILVDLRGQYLTATGDPDWAGSTRALKTAVGDIYRAAGYREIQTISAALRWHVGNVLRERLTPEELDAAGLSAETPRARSVTKRERTAAVLASLRPVVDEDDAAPVDPTWGVAGARTLLERVASDAVSSLSLRERENCRRALGQIEIECKRIRAAL